MWRLIALALVAMLTTSCGESVVFEDLADGRCTSAQDKLIEKHISGQIDALAKKDWKLAYSFASTNFQEKVSVDEFIFIITAQYSMLIQNQGYEFNKCAITGGAIAQEVRIKGSNQVYGLTYQLSVTGSTLGIESAAFSEIEDPLNT
jgi:hypothetical protein